MALKAMIEADDRLGYIGRRAHATFVALMLAWSLTDVLHSVTGLDALAVVAWWCGKGFVVAFLMHLLVSLRRGKLRDRQIKASLIRYLRGQDPAQS